MCIYIPNTGDIVLFNTMLPYRSAANTSPTDSRRIGVLQCVAVCCSLLHCVAVCCSVLQCVAVCHSVLQCAAFWLFVLHAVALCRTLLRQCVAVCCSVWQCVAPYSGIVLPTN